VEKQNYIHSNPKNIDFGFLVNYIWKKIRKINVNKNPVEKARLIELGLKAAYFIGEFNTINVYKDNREISQIQMQ
jgi:hypothetical protein